MDGERATDKLHASLNHDRRESSGGLGAEYWDACTAWFAGLSEKDRSVAKAAADAYRNGYPMRAKQIAAALPPAPRYPLA